MSGRAISGKVVNLDEFLEKMGKLKEGVSMENAARAVQAGAYIVEGYAKVNITDQELVDTGNLRSSIQTELGSVDGNGAEAFVGTGIVYAAIHEFGGIIHSTSGKGLHFQAEDGQWVNCMSVTIPARPYLRPAVDEHELEIMDAIGEELVRGIEGGVL
jgi:HK97 gp10 family phage protein